MTRLHLIYLSLSILIMLTVARSLSRNGRVFLIDVFGSPATADAVNRLLVIGFCTTKIGYAALAIRWGGRPDTFIASCEFLSRKIGAVLFLLGIMHAVNMMLLTAWHGNPQRWPKWLVQSASSRRPTA